MTDAHTVLDGLPTVNFYQERKYRIKAKVKIALACGNFDDSPSYATVVEHQNLFTETLIETIRHKPV